MSDEPDPESPYFLLGQADADLRHSHVQLEMIKAEAGPPITIPWKIAYYGRPSHRPTDFYEGEGLSVALDELEHDPAAIASKRLAARIDELAPDTTAGFPVHLVGPEGAEPLEYVALDGRDTVVARDAESAREGDHQWGPFAFRASEAPAKVFTLAYGDRHYLLVSRDIAEELRGQFTDLSLSPFHLTQATGGARPAIAALKRLLTGGTKPEDKQVVAEALRPKPARKAKPKPKPKAKPKPKPKAKPKPKPKAKPKKRQPASRR